VEYDIGCKGYWQVIKQYAVAVFYLRLWNVSNGKVSRVNAPQSIPSYIEKSFERKVFHESRQYVLKSKKTHSNQKKNEIIKRFWVKLLIFFIVLKIVQITLKTFERKYIFWSKTTYSELKI